MSKKYNTNLASEFHVLSCLYRLGIDASLTLGNKKSVDIIVVRENDELITIDVKGLAGKYEWPADNISSSNPDNHFIILVSYEGDINDFEMKTPRTWIIPFNEIKCFKRSYRNRTNIARSILLKEGSHYENAWHLIDDSISAGL